MPEKLSNQSQKSGISKMVFVGTILMIVWLVLGHLYVKLHFLSPLLFILLIGFGLYNSIPQKILFPFIYLLEIIYIILLRVVGVKGGDFDSIARFLTELVFFFILISTTFFFIVIIIQNRTMQKKKILCVLLTSIIIAIFYHIVIYPL